MNKLLAIVMSIALLQACNTKNDYQKVIHNPALYSYMVHELNSIVMENNFSPIVASRNYTYANIAAYQTIAAGYPDRFNSLSGQIKSLPATPQPTNKNIDFELAALLSFCKLGEAVTFPAGSMQYYVDSIKTLAKEHGMPEEMLKNSVAFSDTVSAVVMAWSKKDNYLQTRSAAKYTVLDSPGRWVPTPPAYTQAMEPHWMEIRPIVMDSADQFIPPPPPTFDVKNKTSKYYQEVISIKNAVDSLTDEQKHIAEFWDDNPFKLNVSGHLMFGTKKFSPPGHWMGVVGIAAQKAGLDFPSSVYAHTITSISLFDAFIQCWDEKYRHNTARPETVINKYFDPNWRPYLQTPPFPEYTCGHSTASASAAEALTSVFGDGFAYTDTTELEFNIKSRSFASFRDAALENNWARFYGGIHFHNSCIVSTAYGKKVGTLVVDRLKMKK